MVISSKVKILQSNETEQPIVSNIIFKDRKITVPARSFLFTEWTGTAGQPLYEIGDLDYLQICEDNTDNGTIYRLESTKQLDIEISNRISTIPDPADYCGDYSDVRGSRVLHIVQQYRNSRTGEVLPHDWRVFETELNKRSTIGKFTIAVHEDDTYTDDDEKRHIAKLRRDYARTADTSENGLEVYIQRYQKVFSGNPKPAHLHIPVQGKFGTNGKVQPIKADLVAGWLGISPSCCKYVIDNTNRGGSDGFLDAVEYCYHRDEKSQLLGKTLYDDEIFVASNFDYHTALEEREANKEYYGIENPTQLQKWEYDLLTGRTTLKRCFEENVLLYGNNLKKLTQWRSDYISNRCPLPPLRQTFYIEAEAAQGGEGKSVITHALAKTLAKEFGADVSLPYYDLTEYIFNVNDSRVSMQHYDGQPIIVLNEMKAGDLMSSFGGRRGVKELLDPFQESKASYNVKFGDCVIVAKYILINGIQPLSEFKTALAKSKDVHDDTSEEKAMRQFDRRFWWGIKVIDSDTIALMHQAKILDDTLKDYRYDELMRITLNAAQMRSRYADGLLIDNIFAPRLQPLLDRVAEANERFSDGAKIKDFSDADKADFSFEMLSPVTKEVAVYVEIRKILLDRFDDYRRSTVYPQRSDPKKCDLVWSEFLEVVDYIRNNSDTFSQFNASDIECVIFELTEHFNKEGSYMREQDRQAKILDDLSLIKRVNIIERKRCEFKDRWENILKNYHTLKAKYDRDIEQPQRDYDSLQKRFDWMRSEKNKFLDAFCTIISRHPEIASEFDDSFFAPSITDEDYDSFINKYNNNDIYCNNYFDVFDIDIEELTDWADDMDIFIDDYDADKC